MWQGFSARDFAPSESVENGECWMYFPFLHWAIRITENRSSHCAVLPKVKLIQEATKRE